ncbi:MAG: TRAM domain-containing protein [Phycisphaerales bacterium]|nr:TRAM domain-containing protein [Phycisphaerales bacterium]
MSESQRATDLGDRGKPQPFLLFSFRLVYLALMIAAASLLLVGPAPTTFEGWLLDLAPLAATIAVGVIVILLDVRTPHKRISNVVGVYLALVAGLFAALAVGALIDLIAEPWNVKDDPQAQQYLTLLKLATGLTLTYLAVSVVLSTRDNIRLLLPYVEFSRQVRGVRPMLLDTSSLIDGRINDIADTGFVDAPLIVAQHVIEELHQLSDSAERGKRERGRRGLANLRLLQSMPRIHVTVERFDDASATDVDALLVDLAEEKNLRVVTTDSSLARVAEIRGVSVLNLHALGGVLRGPVTPGEVLDLEIKRVGESQGQGVGFLTDGTMVVVEDAAEFVGQQLHVQITNSVQTSAGRLVFAQRRKDT